MGHQSPLLTTVFAEQTPTEANADHEIGVWLDAGVITLSTSKQFRAASALLQTGNGALQTTDRCECMAALIAIQCVERSSAARFRRLAPLDIARQ